MAFSAATSSNPSPLLRFPNQSRTLSLSSHPDSISLRFSRSNLARPVSLFIRRSSAVEVQAVEPAISLTENALKHLRKMRLEKNEDLCLRIGVKQGGCSGMSYTMDFENITNARPDDSFIEYEGFVIGNIRFFVFAVSICCFKVNN